MIFFSGNELEATKLWHELSEQYFNKFLSKELSFFQDQQRLRMSHLFKVYEVNLSLEELSAQIQSIYRTI